MSEQMGYPDINHQTISELADALLLSVTAQNQEEINRST